MLEPIGETVRRVSPADLALLGVRGWLVEPVSGRQDCERLLGELGELRPQYGGAIRHEVRFSPGFDDLQYSQSSNPITPHTEAPGEDPPPRYLALHCHRQARCGGGHTVLADGHELIRSVPRALREEISRRPVRFDLAPGAFATAFEAPILSPHADGTEIVRYSYNVLRDGRLEGPVRTADDLAGVDPFHAELCRHGLEFTRRRGTRVLAPDGAVLIFDNWRMLHSRTGFEDRSRHLTRYWIA